MSNSALIDDARRVRLHPKFRNAFEVFAERFQTLFSANFILTRLEAKESNHVIGLFVLRNHFLYDPNDPKSGISVASTQAFCSAHGLASYNRTAAILTLARYGGYFNLIPSEKDRRVKRLEPTKRAFATTKKVFSAYLEALSTLTGDHTYLGWLEDDNQLLLQSLVIVAYDNFVEHGLLINMVPELRLFKTRVAGYEILLKLLTTQTKGEVMPDRTVAFPYRGVAKYFRVSRAHVRKLIEDAERAGYLIIHADGGRAVEILPNLFALNDRLVSLNFALVLRGLNRFKQTLPI